MKQIAFRRRLPGKVSAAYALAVFGLLMVFATVGLQVHQASAAAGIYKTVNFQGKVVNTNGTNVADASYTFRFRIYNHATNDATNSCSANSCLWEESKSITTVNGIFQTNLGDTTTLPGSVDFNSDTLYLAVKFNGDTEMTPRVRLTAVPYAFNADMLDGLDSSALVQLSPSGQQTGSINVSGNITTGAAVNTAAVDAATSSTVLTVGSTNASSVTLGKNTNMGAGLILSLQGSNALSLGSTTAAGGIVFKDGTVNNRAITVQTPGLTASYTLNLPTTAPTAGSQCLQTATGSTTNLSFGSCSGSGSSFVSLQGSTPGTADTGNFNISGIGIAAAFDASTFDTATAGLMSIGTTNANQMSISKGGVNVTIFGNLTVQDTSIAAGKSITFVSGAGNFNMSGSSGTFSTGTGTVGLNGDVTVASGKSLTFAGSTSNFDQSGSSGTFKTGTGAGTLNGDTTVTSGKALAVAGGSTSLTGLSTGSTTALSVVTNATTNIGLTVKGIASQTADLLRLLGANSETLAKFDSNGALTTNGTTTNLLGLAAPVITSPTTVGATGYYALTATNAAGETVISNVLALNSTSATINWTQIPGATGYKLYRNSSNNFTSGSLLRTTITSGATVTFVDNGTATGAGLPPTAPTGTKVVVQGWSGQSGVLFALQDSSGNVSSSFNGAGNQLTLGNATGSGTLQGVLRVSDGTSDGFFGSLKLAGAIAADQNYLLPTTGGTLCTTTSCATGTTASYIQNQNAGAQSSSNFWISGTGRADTSLQAPLLDTATGVALAIGTTNATAINLNQNTQVTGNLSFAVGANRTISVNTQTASNTAGNNLTVLSATGLGTGAGGVLTLQGGTSGSGATGNGGAVNLTGGAAASTNGTGGAVTISGGTGTGTGVQGLINLSTSAFSASGLQTNTIAAGVVDQFSSIPVTANTTGVTVNIPAPVSAVTGRILYVTAASGSNDFTILLAGTSISIAMKQNSTATLIWNGTGWTAAGASSSTDLQSAYNNTLTSAGGAEVVLNPSGGNADGFTIRNNATTPIIGPLLEVQSAIGTNLLSVNNNATELAANGGAETSSSFATDWTASGAPTITRHTTLANVATGQASVQVSTTAASNTGVTNNLSANPAVSTTYQVSFTGKLNSGTFSTLDVQYSRNGGTNLVACGSYSTQTLVTTGWSKVTCTFTTDGTTATNPDLIIRQTDATSRIFWIDNLSVTIITATSTPPNVQIGGGLYGGAATVLTLDRASTAPVTNGNTTLLGSMYYDTTSGRIQCYEADGWGACGSSPDNYVNLVPEFAGAVLDGSGVGTLTADFCANQSGVLQINSTLCSTGQALNFYKWTSPQNTQQTYSIYVTYQLPAAFKQFQSDTTVQLTARTDNTTNGIVTYQMFRSESGTLAACGTETTVTSSANTWQTVGINGNELSGCGFSTSSANNFAIFKINVKANSNANAYVGTLSFTTTGQ